MIKDETKVELKKLFNEVVDERLKELAKPVETEVKPDPQAAKAEDEAQKDLDGKFPRFGSYLKAVRDIRQFGIPDSRLIFMDSQGKATKPFVQVNGKATLVEGTDSAGGFLVPEEFKAQLISVGLERAIVRANGPFVVPMSSDTIKFPRVNDTTHASTVYGGIVGYWQGEGSTYQESEPVFGEIKLTAKKLMGYTKVSDELMQDNAVSLEPWLLRSFGEAWAYFEDIAFLRGTGSGQPLGILNAPCLASVTRGDTDDIIMQDINGIWARVSEGSRGRGVWLANQETLPKLLFLNSANTVTNAYGAPTLFIQNLKDSPSPYQLFGRPLILTEKMSALGDAGDLGFFDFGQYLIGDRQGLTIDMSSQVYWTTGYVAFKFTERVDGQPIPGSALTPYKGSATTSPFVTLSSAS